MQLHVFMDFVVSRFDSCRKQNVLSLTYLIWQSRNFSAIYHICGLRFSRQFDDNTGRFLLVTVHYLQM